MADTKLSALTELATTPAVDDEVYIRDVSEAASAESKRITIANLINTQLDLKAPLASPTFTGTVVIPTPFTVGAVSVAATGTELNYVDGVTSSIQTQLDGKISGVFGDGSDGDVTLSAPLTLTRDMFYNNLTTNGNNIDTAGFRIYVKGTLTNANTIQRKGNDGGDGVAGTAGAGGAALAAGSIGGSAAGGAGACAGGGYNAGGGGGSGGGDVFIAARVIINTGGIISANGGDGGDGAAGTNATNANGAAGSASDPSLGGNGGSGGTNAAANGGAATAPTAVKGGFRAVPAAITLKETEGAGTKILGGAGGGGGRAAGAATDASGGGGGGGGLVVLIYNTLTAGTETASGGIKGAPVGFGQAAVDGSAGTVIKIDCTV